MKRIKITGQVLQDLTNKSQNASDIALRVDFNYTVCSIKTGGV
jgi:hypothetical protein